MPGQRGRPAEGQRIAVRLPEDVLARVDRAARDRGVTRAQLLRRIVGEGIDAFDDGIDRTQIRRMLRLSPADRVAHMAHVANVLLPLRGVARR